MKVQQMMAQIAPQAVKVDEYINTKICMKYFDRYSTKTCQKFQLLQEELDKCKNSLEQCFIQLNDYEEEQTDFVIEYLQPFKQIYQALNINKNDHVRQIYIASQDYFHEFKIFMQTQKPAVYNSEKAFLYLQEFYENYYNFLIVFYQLEFTDITKQMNICANDMWSKLKEQLDVEYDPKKYRQIQKVWIDLFKKVFQIKIIGALQNKGVFVEILQITEDTKQLQKIVDKHEKEMKNEQTLLSLQLDFFSQVMIQKNQGNDEQQIQVGALLQKLFVEEQEGNDQEKKEQE